MSVENHRHCQATVLSANGTGNQNGATWNMISTLNLPNIKHENWLEQFKNNRENITQDIVATLRLINQTAGDMYEEINRLNLKIVQIEGHIDDFTGSTSDISEEITNINNQISNINNQITGLNNRIEGIEGQIDDLSDVTNNINDIYTQINNISTQINNIEEWKAAESEKSPGIVVPDYSAYDQNVHNVSSRDIMTFGNGNDVNQSGGYAIYIDKSRIGNKLWTAREDCFFFPCAYAKALQNTTNQDIVWPLYVFVGDENGDKLFKVFSHDGSGGNDLYASWMVPLKKGQIIALWNGGSETEAFAPDSYWLPVKRQ